jgi:transcription elongation factor GreA
MKKLFSPPPVAPIPLTQAAMDENRAEKKRLQQLRVEVLGRLQIAREMGDLSENGAYTAAKFELGNIGRQLRYINHLLAHGVVVSSTTGNTVGFGSTVTLSNKGKQLAFMLVSQHESDPQKNKLSLESPIGAATVGKKVGDMVIVSTPRGEVEYEVIGVE